MRQRSILCLLAILSCSTLRAQTGGMAGYAQGTAPPPQTPATPATPAPTGTVTGTVILGDTQHPARFAQVMLERIPSATDDMPRPTGFSIGISNAGVRTGLDGTFTTTIAPGDYYVTATVPGYVSEHAILQAALSAGATATDLAAQVPTVHVTAQGYSSAVVTLQRGAALSGRIQWEDGSPVVGVSVTVTPVQPQQPVPPPLNAIRMFGNPQPLTDDRGAFRDSGLVSGDYFVEAIIYAGNLAGNQAGGIAPPIRIYAPGVFRKADAKPIRLHPGDDLDDLRMVIDLRSLHTVSGHVSSTTASQNIVSGRATLVDSSDQGLQPTAMIDARGDFSIPFVPSGTYTLTVQGSTQPSPNGYLVRSRSRSSNSGSSDGVFAPSTQTLVVGDTDITGLAINLTPAQ